MPQWVYVCNTMASLRISAAPEIYESKKCSLLGNFDPYMSDWAGINLLISQPSVGLVVGRGKIVKKSVVRSSKIPVCTSSGSSIDGFSRQNNPNDRLKNNVNIRSEEDCNVALVGESFSAKSAARKSVDLCNKVGGRKSERKIWSRVASKKQLPRTKGSKLFSKKNKHPFVYAREDSQLEAAVSASMLDYSIDHCNSVLRLLVKGSDVKAMTFFERMKSNGKLKNNVTAYNLAMRVLARKEDWNRAQSLLEEMASDCGCELNSQVFNTLIYVCAKRRLNGWGAKWFQMMLERGVQPDAATIGMLMGLYQKIGNLLQAEFTFGQMRSFKLQCVSAYSSMITIYTRMGMYDKSEDIIRLMEEDEVLPNLENWLVRLNAYSQQGKLEEAESVLKAMLESGISPNIVAYNTLITGYGKTRNMKSAQRLFRSLHDLGLEPNETTYRSMVEGFGRADNYKEAMWYYKELMSSGFLPNSSNFYTMINLQARHDNENGTIQTIKDMREMGCQYSSILSGLLHAYETVGRLEKVPTILKSSFYENILLDPTSCSILVMAYVKNSLLDEALQVLQAKKWKDSDFEDNLFHLLICSCKEAGHYENAIEIYACMPKSDIKPNVHVTCSMIGIYSSMNKFTDAENLYLKLKASGVTFDMIAYSIVVRMYIKAGSLKDACSVLDMLEKQKDIIPDTFLFHDMLRTYQQCGMLEKLANTYYWILKSGVRWDEAMYNCVINCCGRALPVDELSRLFDEMMQCGYAANTITFNVMLDVYGKAGLLKKARKVLWMARKQGSADAISYNTIIAAYSRNKDFRSMRSTVRRMQHAGLPVPLEAYNCMLDAYGKEDLIEEFNGVLQKMKEARCTSDHYTYNIMINIYGKKGWIKEVACVLAELKERGLDPDLYSYNTLIKAYGVAGMVEEAVNVVQQMRMKGIKPDRVTFGNLVVALQRNENFLEAVKWSLWMKQMGMSS